MIVLREFKIIYKLKMKFMQIFVPLLLFVSFTALAQGTTAVNEDKKNKPWMVPAAPAPRPG